ncbi:hypothetical protein HY992_03950 [Candidatus Micrarchaeota archaeon]|nr:hypothetical protein [Candidatus Micrarchaeota archaeon]
MNDYYWVLGLWHGDAVSKNPSTIRAFGISSTDASIAKKFRCLLEELFKFQPSKIKAIVKGPTSICSEEVSSFFEIPRENVRFYRNDSYRNHCYEILSYNAETKRRILKEASSLAMINDKNSALSFIGGFLDADGYVNPKLDQIYFSGSLDELKPVSILLKRFSKAKHYIRKKKDKNCFVLRFKKIDSRIFAEEIKEFVETSSKYRLLNSLALLGH